MNKLPFIIPLFCFLLSIDDNQPTEQALIPSEIHTSNLQQITADAAVYIPKRGAYIFSGNQYYKYKLDLSGQKPPQLLRGYPKKMPGGWQNLPEYFRGGIDAGFYYAPTKKTYLFKGGQYIRLTDIKVDAGYPKKLPGGFRGLPKIFQRDIDAAFTVKAPTGRQTWTVLIKNNDFVVLNQQWKKVHTGQIKSLWKNLPAPFQNEIQAAIYGGFWGNYLFTGKQVVLAPGQTAQADPFFSVNNGGAGFGAIKNTDHWKLSARQASDWSIAKLCPEGNMCPELFQLLFDVQIRSYVPPRFTYLGSDAGNKMSMEVENMESFHQYKSLTREGCRYSINKVSRAIRDDMDFFEQFADLFSQMRNQWQGFYDNAKSAVAGVVAAGVCGVVDPTPTCEKNVSAVVNTGINVGLAALGIPPEIPDLEQIRSHGIEYLATQGAQYAVGGADRLVGEALSPAIRAAAYEAAYHAAKKEFSKQLDKQLPIPTYEADDPATWGRLLPMYAPHNARMYLEIKVKNRAAYKVFLGENFVAYPSLQLKDSRNVFQRLTIPLPEYIPEEGMFIPLELRPSEDSKRNSDGSQCTNCPRGQFIPGEVISQHYLWEKFTINDLLMQQKNIRGKFTTDNPGYSDWDLFYRPYYRDDRSASVFELSGNFSFKDGSQHYPRFHNFHTEKIRLTNVWDRLTGMGVLKEITPQTTAWEKKKKIVKDYYGRQDPLCPCDKKLVDPDCYPEEGNVMWMPW